MKKELDSLYKSIDQKGKAAILKNQFTDPYLCQVKADSRRGLTLLARLPVHVGRNIGYAQQKLRIANPNLYCYPLTDLHLTVLDRSEHGLIFRWHRLFWRLIKTASKNCWRIAARFQSRCKA